jgi:hypothetical protein
MTLLTRIFRLNSGHILSQIRSRKTMEISDIAQKVHTQSKGMLTLDQSQAVAGQMLESTHGGISPEDIRDVTVAVDGDKLDIQLHVDFDTMPTVIP